MFSTKEKKERALGTKLFLKAERCASGKCAMVRRPYRPGLHGKGRVTFSEPKLQLQEKQKIKLTYGIREAQMRKVFSIAAKRKGVTGEEIMSLLERRLDNVVYRLGFVLSRSIGRQAVGHGHFLVNGRRVTAPSYGVEVDDIITIRPQSATCPIFKDLEANMKKAQVPIWLFLDPNKKEGKVVSLPKDLDNIFDVNMVVDYYSK